MQTTNFFFKKNLHKLTLWLKMSQDTYLWLNGDDALDFAQKSKLDGHLGWFWMCLKATFETGTDSVSFCLSSENFGS